MVAIYTTCLLRLLLGGIFPLLLAYSSTAKFNTFANADSSRTFREQQYITAA